MIPPNDTAPGLFPEPTVIDLTGELVAQVLATGDPAHAESDDFYRLNVQNGLPRGARLVGAEVRHDGGGPILRLRFAGHGLVPGARLTPLVTVTRAPRPGEPA